MPAAKPSASDRLGRLVQMNESARRLVGHMVDPGHSVVEAAIRAHLSAVGGQGNPAPLSRENTPIARALEGESALVRLDRFLGVYACEKLAAVHRIGERVVDRPLICLGHDMLRPVLFGRPHPEPIGFPPLAPGG